MSNPNPLVPQGSVLEQQAKSRPHLRIALCIVAAHLVFLGLLLMQGCKREEPQQASTSIDLSPLDTNVLSSNAVSSSTLPPFNGTAAQPGVPADQGQAGGLPPITGLGTQGTPQPIGAGTAQPGPQPYPQPAVQPIVEEHPLAPATTQYTVAKNDSFYSIGRKFQVSASAIAKANPGVDSTRLKIGQKLQIPAPSPSAAASAGSQAALPSPMGSAPSAGGTYTVKSGDTLMKIARQHGTTYTALMELNGLKTVRINPGQKLKVPVKAAAPVAPEPAPAAVTPAPSTSFPGAGDPVRQ